MYLLIRLVNPAHDVRLATIGWLGETLDAARHLIVTSEPVSVVRRSFAHFADEVQVQEITPGEYEAISRQELGYWAPRPGPMGHV
jgi:hypothetical protein